MSSLAELGSPIASGRTADIFAWGDGQILKLYRRWVPDHDADHEAAMTTAVRRLGLPVPHCFGPVAVEDRRGIIFERVVGTPLLDTLLTAPQRAEAVARTLGTLQAQMHALHAAGLPSLHQRLHDRIEQAEPLAPRWQAAARQRLRGLPAGNSVCHGDFHPANVIATSAGPVIIDWVDVAAGNPLADVARTVMLMRYAAPPADATAWHVSDALRSALVAAYLAAYRAARPAPEADLAQWLPLVAAARLAEGPLPEQAALFRLLEMSFGPSGT